MKTPDIESIRKKFHNEWLLIAIGKMDETTSIPLTGRLIAHSKNRDDIYDKSIYYKGRALVVSSEDNLPEGYAAAFLLW